MLSNLLGLSGFAYAFYFVVTNHATQFNGFYDKSALVLLLLAPLSVILMSHGTRQLLDGVRIIFSMAISNQQKEMLNIANILTALGHAVRQEGMGAVNQYKSQAKNQLFREGLTLILNSFTADEIRHNIIAKINTRQAQMHSASNMFETLGKLCPAMGLVGTIAGLVLMLSNLSDPTKIGAGMAVSLLATLYGLVLGTVVYTPVAEKIHNSAEKTRQLETMILEGLILLKEKKSQAHLRDVIGTYSENGRPQGQAGRKGAA